MLTRSESSFIALKTIVLKLSVNKNPIINSSIIILYQRTFLFVIYVWKATFLLTTYKLLLEKISLKLEHSFAFCKDIFFSFLAIFQGNSVRNIGNWVSFMIFSRWQNEIVNVRPKRIRKCMIRWFELFLHSCSCSSNPVIHFYTFIRVHVLHFSQT